MSSRITVFKISNTRTMATWGGSTQCALDVDDEEVYLSDGLGQAEEEEEEQDSSSNELSICPNNMDQNMYSTKEDKERLVIYLVPVVNL